MGDTAPNSYKTLPDEAGRFGIHGGRFVAETLMPLILEVLKVVNMLMVVLVDLIKMERSIKQYVLGVLEITIFHLPLQLGQQLTVAQQIVI